MGKINPRNRQLTMAFADGDLLRPAHDRVMHWLSSWTRNSANLESLLGDWPQRRAAIRVKLTQESYDVAKAADILSQIEAQLDLRSTNSKDSVYRKDAWNAEPARNLRSRIRSRWEQPLV